MTVGSQSHNERVYFLSSVCFLVLVYAQNNNEKRQQDVHKSVSRVLLNPVVTVGRWKLVVYWSEVWCFKVPLRITLSLRLRTAWDGIKTRRESEEEPGRRWGRGQLQKESDWRLICAPSEARTLQLLPTWSNLRMIDANHAKVSLFVSCRVGCKRAALPREKARNNGCQASLRHSNTR